MDDLIQISKLNDFLYSPKSLYFHSAFEEFDTSTYHSTAQTIGRMKHEPIDTDKYSSKKDILQSLKVYSEKYSLIGKIDLYDQQTKTLIERKTTIKKIQPGYKIQLWAQYLCLVEMGYDIQHLELYSMTDNKKYTIPLPTQEDLQFITNLINQIKNYNPLIEFIHWKTQQIDQNTIYNTLYF